MKEKPIIAIMYDFDYTLCKEDMQNFSLIPALNLKPSEFWAKAGEFANKTGCERILSYMYVLIEECRKKGIKCRREFLNSLGSKIEYFPGVIEYFKRINEYAEKKNIILEHYIISSGNKEIIEGSLIAKEFKNIFACEYCYDEKTSLPIWPKLAINYTQKTQFLYRICKGVTDTSDDVNVNKKVASNNRIKHRNVIYIGDGLTDVPCMTIVKNYGGKSIAVYTEDKKETAITLLKEDRINYACKADYNSDQQLDKVIKLIIDNIAITEELESMENKI